MTRDCQDADDAPDGSIADLQEDFASAIDDFRERAREDMQKRADAEAVGKRTDAEPEGPARLEKSLYTAKQPPFNPQPVLLVPHYGEGARRPVPQRKRIAASGDLAFETTHPLRSEGLSVKTGPDGDEVDVVSADGSYTVEGRIRNVGGLPARSAVVELYVEHKEPQATIDVNEETGRFEVSAYTSDKGRQYWNYVLSGTTTMAPGSQLFAYFHGGESKAPPWDGPYLGGTPIASNEGRVFESTGATGFERGTDGVWTVDIWDVSRVEEDQSGSALKRNGIHLARSEMEIVSGNPTDDRRIANHDLTASVNLEGEETSAEGSAKRVGKRRVSVPQNGTRTVSFSYEPSRGEFPNADLPNAELPSGGGRAVTAFYLRTYSLTGNEVPADWGQLDHTESRFMGRTEVGREL